jgi:hypothetical protein
LGAPLAGAADLSRDLADDDCGVVVMCAASSREKALEDSRQGHGYFTLALMEGLAGRADYNGDGEVYLTELNLYLEDRVGKLSQGRQHPVIVRPSTVTSFALSRP